MPLVHGWMVRAHPLLLDQLEKLTASVEALAKRRPGDFQQSPNAKLLAALQELVFNKVPLDPASSQYRQGKTLGSGRKHWFRAKFGNGRFRLFFRYDSRARIIVFAWVNDENSLRTYGSRTDAYAVFERMLDKGNPPDDWAELLKAASAKEAQLRLGEAQAKES
jgi:toxin YhaV